MYPGVIFDPGDVSARARILANVYLAPYKTVALTFVRALYFIQVMFVCKAYLGLVGQVVIGDIQYSNVFRLLTKYDRYN